jgi:hypothetical protein
LLPCRDEYAPVAALGRLIQSLDPSRVRGTLSLVPVANRLAFEGRTMYLTPGDGLNLNRTFPGDARGSYTQVLADLLWQHIASRASHLLDIHGGELVEGLVPFTGAYALEGQADVAVVSRQLAEFHTPTWWQPGTAARRLWDCLAHVATVRASWRAGRAVSAVASTAGYSVPRHGIATTLRAILRISDPPTPVRTNHVRLDEIVGNRILGGSFHARVSSETRSGGRTSVKSSTIWAGPSSASRRSGAASCSA